MKLTNHIAGTGNVLKIQQLLHICSEHYEQEKEAPKEKKKDDKKEDKDEKKEDVPLDLSGQQAIAVIGLGLLAMGEDIGSEMLTRLIFTQYHHSTNNIDQSHCRTLSHLMRYGEPVIRRAVPLALAMVSVSNPQLTILDTLSKFSHDTDPEVAHNAIFGLGLLGAGNYQPITA